MSDGLLKWENPGRRPGAGVGRLGPLAPSGRCQKAQRKLEGREATVVLRDGRRFRADGVAVSPEAVVGWEAGSGTRHSAPPGDVEAVCYRERGRGALEGAGLGALVGAGVGAAWGAVAGASWCRGEEEPILCALIIGGLGAFGGAIFVAPAGAIGGLVIGAVRGSRICVRFASDGSP
jgi:hypothetical protein